MLGEKDTAPNIAIFYDYENVAIGAEKDKHENFDIHLVLQRLLENRTVRNERNKSKSQEL
jgi:hypothetical protein